jgi:putative nucleotidyltransferase with HDIG domain
MTAQCVIRRPNPLSRHWLLTWEDTVFGGMTVAVFLLPKGHTLFHLYTLLVVILVLSLAYRRGLAVGLLRMLILTGVLVLLQKIEGFSRHFPLLEVAGLSGGGLISGLIGEMQRRSRDALERSFSQMIEVLARALECRDPYTEGHSRRTAMYAVEIAQEMGLESADTVVLEQAGLLHDLGKMGMPDAILRKNGVLTTEEEKRVMQHPDQGSRILRDIPALAQAAKLVRHHHEHYDGSGYPDGLAREAIPLAARILTVADVFDALTTDRPYRKAVVPWEAVQHIKKDAGVLFDPEVVKALERIWWSRERELAMRVAAPALQGSDGTR